MTSASNKTNSLTLKMAALHFLPKCMVQKAYEDCHEQLACKPETLYQRELHELLSATAVIMIQY